MVLEMDFASMANIENCMASDIKTKAHAATLEVLQPFTNRFFHFITESRTLAAGGA